MTTESAYRLPVARDDTGESDRLKVQHECIKLLFDGVYTAPLPPKIGYAADLACGTGVWTRDFAALHPETEVIGIDINPPTLLPDDPSNLKFVVGDIEQDWSFADQAFDYIWVRLVFTFLKDWPRFFRRIAQHLKPGGYLEIYDMVPTATSDDFSVSVQNSAFIRWHDICVDRMRQLGAQVDSVLKFGEIATDAGLEVVKNEHVPIYLDAEIAAKKDDRLTGELVRKYNLSFDQIIDRLTEGMFNDRTTPTLIEHRILAEEARQDIKMNAKARGYAKHHISFVARKP